MTSSLPSATAFSSSSVTQFSRKTPAHSPSQASTQPSDVRFNSFKTEYKSVMAALKNVSRSLSMSAVAKQGHEDFTSIVEEMRKLSKAMESKDVTAADRANAQTELSSKRQNLDDLVDKVRYRGEMLFDGSYSGQIQLGSARADTLAYQFSDYRSTAFPSPAGLHMIDISTQAGAVAGTAILDDALNELQGLGIEIGALEFRLHSEADLLTRTSMHNQSQIEKLSDEMKTVKDNEDMDTRTAFLKQAASKLMLGFGNPSGLLPILLE